MHLKTLPIRFPEGGTFLYKLLPAMNITKNKKVQICFDMHVIPYYWSKCYKNV